MKKILFCLVCVLTCFSMVSAKTQIEYDWGEYVYLGQNHGMFYDFVVDGDDYYALYRKDYSDVVFKYKEGDLHYEYSFAGLGDWFYINDQLIKINLEYDGVNDLYFQYVYDKEFNFKKRVQIGYNDFFDKLKCLKSENEKYYVIGNMTFDKEKNEFFNVETQIENSSYGEEFNAAISDNDFEKATELMKKFVFEEFKDTHLPYIYSVEEYLYDSNFNIVDLKYDNNSLAMVLYNSEIGKYTILIFDKNCELMFEEDFVSLTTPKVLFKDSVFYIFLLTVDNYDIDQYDYLAHYEMLEYDYNGNELSKINLSYITDNGEIHDYTTDYGRKIAFVEPTETGFYLLSHRTYSLKGWDPTLEENDVISNDMPTIQKYSFVYSVETKENENGTIEVDKDSSKSGDSITYIVKPKEGYKLDKVIVTDESGNTIEITDTSFTMPSSNVTIEAIFVVENPNTSVFLSVAVACIILFVCYFFIIQKNMRVKQFE